MKEAKSQAPVHGRWSAGAKGPDLRHQSKTTGAHPEVKKNIANSSVMQELVHNIFNVDFSKLSVFDLRPEAIPSRNDYAGTIIPMGITYYSQLRDLDPGQKMRRFKVSNFKEKSLIFEDNNLQVGFKSRPVYEETDTLRIYLNFTVFFGNRGNAPISNMKIDFEGDDSNLYLM